MRDDPRLYAIAKQITLDAGFPYTDPRTLETTRPTTMKNNKKPTWVLLDQWHVDLEIKSDMPATERQTLKRKVNEIMNTFFKSNRKNYRLKVSQ